MSATSLYSLRAAFLVALGTLFFACDEGVLAPPPSGEPAAGKPPSGPYFASITISLPGQTSAVANDINDAHEVVGYALFPNNGGSAFYWGESLGGTTPQVLPPLPGKQAGLASDISETGEVAGASGEGHHGSGLGQAVPTIWTRTGLAWTPRALGGWGHAWGLNDRGEAVGTRYVQEAPWLSEAVHWDADGRVTVLTLPEGFVRAEAFAINNDGDIAGALVTSGGANWAALWVAGEAGSWTPAVLTGGPVRDLTDRDPAGTLMASGLDGNAKGECCIPIRWTVTIAADGQVVASRSVLGTDLLKWGTGLAINGLGDVAGSGTPGNNWAGTPIPVLYPMAESTVKLPLTRRSTGAVHGISLDRWMAGRVEADAVVWHPAI